MKFNDIQITEEQFVLKDPLQFPWYQDEADHISNLGQLYNCSFQDRDNYVCRIIDFTRLNNYVTEAFFHEYLKIHWLHLDLNIQMIEAIFIK